MTPATLTIEEASFHLQLHPVTCRKMCSDGVIPGAKRVGSEWRIPRNRFFSWLEADQPPSSITLTEPRKRLRAIASGGKWN